MVCLGNICRSPLAQGILESKSSKLIVESAGTAKFHVGKSPDLRSINVAKKHNIDISKQRARQFSNLDFQKFDKIYAMDNDNYSKIISLAKDQEEIDKVELILNEEYPRTYKSVPDPYVGQKDGFQYIYDLLNSVCNKIIEKYEVR